MDRLTQRREDGAVIVHKREYSDFHMKYVNAEHANDPHHIRLAEYEDTGLMPEKILALKNQLAVAERALEQASELHAESGGCPADLDCITGCCECWRDFFLRQAKEGDK